MDVNGFIEFCENNYLFFMISLMIYTAIPGFLTIYYALKSRKHPEKVTDSSFFKNEVSLAFLFLLIAGLMPVLFDKITPTFAVKAQIYFHLWDTVTVCIIVWTVLSIIWKKHNKVRNKILSEVEWQEQISDNFKDCFKTDITRKASHFLFAAVLFILHFIYFTYPFKSWDQVSSALFMMTDFLVVFIWIFTPFELLRLLKFDVLGKFAQDMGKISIYPDELYTFTSSLPLMLSVIPFVLVSPQILYSVALIGALSDSAASIIGKRFGKRRSDKTKKTWEGYIAGFTSSFCLVFVVHLILPFSGINIFGVMLMAFGAATGFLLVDRFAKTLPDNFLNPIVCGLILTAIYYVLV
ncbi:MAG: hypothetical protein GF364_14775 [Candidatus Lokiarchaeota archaeon]|nr:hypothetical protein [Candidatus Lokiarchaeota archaeon]